MARVDGVSIEGAVPAGARWVLSPDAVAFVAELHRRFDGRRLALLDARKARQSRLDAGALPTFLKETEWVRSGSWRCPPPPADLEERRVEITGPPDRKMVINALNSGANVFMADFEDSLAPTWENLLNGQVNLRDAIAGTISLESGGKRYKLKEKVATLLVRPRGWHLNEEHFRVDGAPVSGTFRRVPPSVQPVGERVRARQAPCSTLGCTFSTMRIAYCRMAAARISTCPRWSLTARRACGTTCSCSLRVRAAFHKERFGQPCSSRQYWRRSKWTRSYTSCATTRSASTAVDGTTSSA